MAAGQKVNSDVAFNMVVGGIIGTLAGMIMGFFLISKIFPPPQTIPSSVASSVGWFFWWGIALSAAFGMATAAALTKRSELRNLRSFVDMFYSPENHQDKVDDILKILAIQTNTASREAINLRANGVKSFTALERSGDTAKMDPDQVLKMYRQVQEDAENFFHKKQASFYIAFDIAAKFKRVFSLNLKERKFKAYLLTESEQAAERAES